MKFCVGAEPKFKIGNNVFHDKYGYCVQGRIVMFHHVVVDDVVIRYDYTFRANSKGSMLTNEQFEESLKHRDMIIEESYIHIDPDPMTDWGDENVGGLPMVVDTLVDI